MVYLKELTKFNKSVSTNVLNFLKDYWKSFKTITPKLKENIDF